MAPRLLVMCTMRRFSFLVLIAIFAFFGGASRAAAPMEFRELRLLVQGRVPEAEIVADLQRRKLAKALSEDEIGELAAAGAGRNLLAAVAKPELLVSAEVAAKYEADKERSAQRAKLLSLPARLDTRRNHAFDRDGRHLRALQQSVPGSDSRGPGQTR